MLSDARPKQESVNRHDIYPIRYFDASPTWNMWNKLTAVDIHHTLHTKPDFEGQNIYFSNNNHPIRFVRIVGLFVAINLKPKGKYTVLTIDDNSGACINVKINRREVPKGGTLEDYPANTSVNNVDVDMDLGIPTLVLDFKPVPIGSVLELKGTISTCREVRRIELKRLFLIRDTNAEARAWARTVEYKQSILSRPWVLTLEQVRGIDERLEQEEKHAVDIARKEKEWLNVYSEKKRLHDEKHEVRRKTAENKYNAGALKGSNVIPAP